MYPKTVWTDSRIEIGYFVLTIMRQGEARYGSGDSGSASLRTSGGQVITTCIIRGLWENSLRIGASKIFHRKNFYNRYTVTLSSDGIHQHIFPPKWKVDHDMLVQCYWNSFPMYMSCGVCRCRRHCMLWKFAKPTTHYLVFMNWIFFYQPYLNLYELRYLVSIIFKQV